MPVNPRCTPGCPKRLHDNSSKPPVCGRKSPGGAGPRPRNLHRPRLASRAAPPPAAGFRVRVRVACGPARSEPGLYWAGPKTRANLLPPRPVEHFQVELEIITIATMIGSISPRRLGPPGRRARLGTRIQVTVVAGPRGAGPGPSWARRPRRGFKFKLLAARLADHQRSASMIGSLAGSATDIGSIWTRMTRVISGGAPGRPRAAANVSILFY